MSSIWCRNLKISIFGESHGKAVGVTIDGLPAGESLDIDKIIEQMQRRAPGRDKTATKRKESDIPSIITGFFEGKTTGTPLTAIIENSDTRSSDYAQHAYLPRPSHADYTAYIRYGGFADMRGSGHFSGRLTAPLVFAGAVCRQILERRGILIGAHVYSIGDICDLPFDPVKIDAETLKHMSLLYFPVQSEQAKDKMRAAINKAAKQGDSLGGIVECAATGIPAGIGSPMFGGVENVIASIVFAIPAVKGLEFGAGFLASKMTGSSCNDAFCVDEKGKVVTATNNSGGIQGGITNGMPLLLRAAFKPTPSIAKQQQTVNLKTLENETLVIRGRHDPCIVPRAVPAVEAAVAIALCDLMAEVNML